MIKRNHRESRWQNDAIESVESREREAASTGKSVQVRRVFRREAGKSSKYVRKAVLIALVSAIGITPLADIKLPWSLSSGVVYAAQGPVVTKTGESIISDGAVLRTYIWKSTRKGSAVTTNGKVIAVDLQNPNVKLDVMTGKDGKLTQRNTVLGMAKDSGAIAGVNGDFYNTKADGAPIGGQITNGAIVSTPSYLPGFYTFAIDKDNKPIVDTFTFKGDITTEDGTTYPLGGINKTYYWYEDASKPPTPQTDPVKGIHSMTDGLYIYTSAWGSTVRANDGSTIPTEVLVRNDIIEQIAPGKMLSMAPPEDGYILRASGKAAEFVTQHMQVGQKLTSNYGILPTDPNKKYDTSGFKMMIGGHSIIVDNGAAATYSRSVSDIAGYRARTAVGYTKDGKYALIIAVDSNETSDGMSISELQQFMIDVGVWKGMILDGGGSTQMVARPLGEFNTKLANSPEYGSQRQVVNGLGVFTTAPQGDINGFIVDGRKQMLIGEQVSFGIKAYDQYYNPLDPKSLTVQWSANAQAGTFADNVFTALKAGMTTVTVSAENGAGKTVKQDYPVEVIGGSQVKGMYFSVPKYLLSEGVSYKLPVYVITKNDVQIQVPPNMIKWQLKGVEGTFDGDTFTVTKVKDKTAQLKATYDGISEVLTLPAGEYKMWENFENVNYLITGDGYPSGIIGRVRLTDELAGQPKGNRALALAYDFTEGTATKAAYMVFNSDKGVAVPGQPQNMRLRVFGDNSLNWLRAEITDAGGKLQRIDIAKTVNWSGWKTVNVNLSELGLAYPFKINRIYLANPEEGQDERAATGEIAIDDISFQYSAAQQQTSKSKITLTVGKTTFDINGVQKKMDQAPVIIGNRTYVPIKFVADALGGQTKWGAADRKVTVTLGDNVIELWVDQTLSVVDGRKVVADAAPVIRNSRTLVPLRLLSENLGRKVTWKSETQTIIVE